MTEDGNGDHNQLRALSKTLLGSLYQAEIGAAIADSSETIWGKKLLVVLGDDAPTKGQVGSELEKLQRVKLLAPADENRHDRRKLLRPVDPKGAYWALCQELRRTAESA
jgi:hypothetical protein